MGASKKIKTVMADKKIKSGRVAERIGREKQYVYNILNRDNMSYERVEQIAEALGCEIIFRDKETGKEY